jgi:hypothetical protein
MDLRAWIQDAHHDLRPRLIEAVLDRVPVDQWTIQADGGGSSITWLVLHLTRHHDLALQTAVRNRAPRFAEHAAALGLAEVRTGAALTGAGLTEREDREISLAVRPDALVAYLDDVLETTARWLHRLSGMALDTVPDTERRLTQVAGLDPDELGWLVRMWQGRTVSWLVQWPMLGHVNAHTGEAVSVRNRLGLSPF